MTDTTSKTELHPIEQTAIATCHLLHLLQAELARQDKASANDITLGIIMGTAMFCDDKVGPFRAQKLMRDAPEIVLKTDAHATESLIAKIMPSLRKFGQTLADMF